MKGAYTNWQIYIQCRGSSKAREKLFHAIWNLYRKRLMYFIRNFVRDDTEDIFQEIMLKVFQNIEKYNPLYPFNTWFYTIARNHCVNHIRKGKLPVVPGDPEPMLSESSAASQENDVIRKELYRKIDRVLSAFSEDNRQIAYLRFFEGMKHREIARIMDIPTGTVKSRLHACRSILRKVLEEYNER